MAILTFGSHLLIYYNIRKVHTNYYRISSIYPKGAWYRSGFHVIFTTFVWIAYMYISCNMPTGDLAWNVLLPCPSTDKELMHVIVCCIMHKSPLFIPVTVTIFSMMIRLCWVSIWATILLDYEEFSAKSYPSLIIKSGWDDDSYQV